MYSTILLMLIPFFVPYTSSAQTNLEAQPNIQTTAESKEKKKTSDEYKYGNDLLEDVLHAINRDAEKKPATETPTEKKP